MKLPASENSEKKQKKRFTVNDRMVQALFVLLFQGPMDVPRIARSIASFTGEGKKSVRVLLYRALPKLLENKLVTRTDKGYDITPFGIRALLTNVKSKYLPFAILRAFEDRYPHLLKYLSALCFICEHPLRGPNIEDVEWWDDYVKVKVRLETPLPDLVLEIKLDSILNNVQRLGIVLETNLQYLINRTCRERMNKTRGPLLFESCTIETEEELKCLNSDKCPPLEKPLSELLSRHNVKLSPLEAYNIRKLVAEVHDYYIEGCAWALYALFLSDMSPSGDLGLLTQYILIEEFISQLVITAATSLLLRSTSGNQRDPIKERLFPSVLVERLGVEDANFTLELFTKSLSRLRDWINKVTKDYEKNT